MPQINDRKTIAICLPGEHFSSVWLSNFLQMFAQLFSQYNVVPLYGYSSNVYHTRGRLLQGLVDVDRDQTQIDYVLWVDDDNAVNWPHVAQLIADLDESPELDAVAGWCWVQPDGYAIHAIPSCGMFKDEHSSTPLDLHKLVIIDGQYPEGPELVPVEYTGFPIVLMRWERFRMFADVKPFTPILAPELECGFMGEDTGFWKRAGWAGLKLAVDRRVKVPHYKLRAAERVSTPAANVALIDG